MNKIHSTIQRPKRWDEPLDPRMSGAIVQQLLKADPFRLMDPDSFSSAIPLAGILRNDCRLHNLEEGDIIVREGDYGSSAFLIIEGEAVVSLESLAAELLGRKPPNKRSILAAVGQLFTNSRFAESRDYSKRNERSENVGARQDETGTHIFCTTCRVSFLQGDPCDFMRERSSAKFRH